VVVLKSVVADPVWIMWPWATSIATRSSTKASIPVVYCGSLNGSTLVRRKRPKVRGSHGEPRPYGMGVPPVDARRFITIRADVRPSKIHCRLLHTIEAHDVTDPSCAC